MLKSAFGGLGALNSKAGNVIMQTLRISPEFKAKIISESLDLDFIVTFTNIEMIPGIEQEIVDTMAMSEDQYLQYSEACKNAMQSRLLEDLLDVTQQYNDNWGSKRHKPIMRTNAVSLNSR